MQKCILYVIIALLLSQLPNKINAQVSYDTTIFQLLPFKSSYTLFQRKENILRGLPSSGINFFSDCDSVFSLMHGIVQKVVLLDTVYSIIIKSQNEITMAYYNLSMTPLTKGHHITKGDFIGRAFYNELAKDHYLSIVMKKGKSHLSHKEHMDVICSLTQCK